MERQSSHSMAPNRSRSSQSPSQSHSASASVCSSAQRRKLDSDDNASPFPFSYSDTRDGALTPNDDFKSISARSGNTDLEEDSEEVGGGEHNSSMRVFRNARLQKKANLRNRKVKGKVPSVKKMGKEEFPAISAVMKEGTMSSLLVENIPKPGAYSAREEDLKREVRSLEIYQSLIFRGKRLLVIGTTSELQILKSLGIYKAFTVTHNVPAMEIKDVRKVLEQLHVFAEEDLDTAAKALNKVLEQLNVFAKQDLDIVANALDKIKEVPQEEVS